MIPAVIERCAGIDIGKKFLVCCVATGPAREDAQMETRRFDTIVGELMKLKAWLAECQITHVVMESRGVYWKPVFNILEDAFEVVLANAQEVKNRRGHKTDWKDSEWLAHLLRHGMIGPGFIPPRAIRDLRDLTRRRKQMIRMGADERNRVQKVMEDANVKIGDVLSDVFSMTGQAMLEALLGRKAGAGRDRAVGQEAGEIESGRTAGGAGRASDERPSSIADPGIDEAFGVSGAGSGRVGCGNRKADRESGHRQRT